MIQIAVDQVEITRFCRKHHIRKLAFFGSVRAAGPEGGHAHAAGLEPVFPR